MIGHLDKVLGSIVVMSGPGTYPGRGTWTKADEAVAWIALVEGMHGGFSHTWPRFCRKLGDKPQRSPAAAPIQRDHCKCRYIARLPGCFGVRRVPQSDSRELVEAFFATVESSRYIRSLN